jgi:rhodanese-related sulfurtransferase
MDDTTREAPFILDVREPWEYDICSIPGAQSLPMENIPARWRELPRERDIVVVCHHGMRSLQVAHFLAAQGYADVANLTGGIDAWSRTVDPTVPTY